jgi:hypothetical protein
MKYQHTLPFQNFVIYNAECQFITLNRKLPINKTFIRVSELFSQLQVSKFYTALSRQRNRESVNLYIHDMH